MIIDFVTKKFPNLNITFKEQKILDGDGGAVYLALQDCLKDEELYVIFGADTLIDFDLKKEIKKLKTTDAGVFVTKVEQPQHYGVVLVNDNMIVSNLEEKPLKPKSDLAVIGAYYFKSLICVKTILGELYEKKDNLKGEYKIAQVLDKIIKNKQQNVKAVEVNKWFDCGRVDVLLSANRYFLEKKSKSTILKKGNSIIIPPCFIDKSSKLDGCVIGPYVSVGKGVEIKNSIIKNSIINESSYVESAFLDGSLIGKETEFVGKANKLNLGEKSHIYLN